MKIIPDDGVAFVTGASRGIGRAIALKLAGTHRPMALLARSVNALEATADEARKISTRQVLAIPCDVSDDEALLSAVRQARSALGPIRLLVNNAGTFLEKPLTDTSAAEFRHVLGINAVAPFLLARTVAADMRDAGGGIVINIASNAGRSAYEGQGAYCASKHALLGWAGVFALEVRRHNIRVHNVCPGGVETAFIAGTTLADRLADQAMIQPEDIAELVDFLTTRPANLDLPEIIVRRFTR